MAKGPEAVDFFDDEDAPDDPPREDTRQQPIRGGGGSVPGDGGSGGGHLHPPANRQQARVRQVGLLLGAIVFLVLIVIAFRGCLDARKDRSFQNYVSDLSTLTADTEQLSSTFFDRLSGDASSSAGDVGFDTEVEGDKGTAQGLLDRAEGLDAPDDIQGAQEQIVLAYDLRTDAIDGVAAALPKLGAGGDEAKKATDAIYTQMKVFSASDILYARAQDQIEQALVDNDVVVDEGVPDSQFLPDDPNYLDPAVTGDALGGVSISTGSGDDSACKDDGLSHGLGLVDGSSVLLPSGTALSNGGTFTAVEGDDTIQVSVQNQGEADESNIDVNVAGDNGIDANGSIDSIAAGETQTVDVKLDPVPKAGESVTLDVEVATVPCEQVSDNNVASYTVSF